VALPAVTSVNGKSGAVIIDVAKPLRLNPADFGAKGDGVTNDTAAIQRCLDAAMATSGNSVEFGAGRFRVSSLTLDYSLAKWAAQGISGEPYGYAAPTITGQGERKTSIVQIAGSTGDIITQRGKLGTEAGPSNNNKITGGTISNLELVGTPGGGYGLLIRSGVNLHYSDVWIRNCGKAAIRLERETFVSGQNDEYMYALSFSNMKLMSNATWGVECSGTASIGATFTNVEALSNGIGGFALNPTNMTLIGRNTTSTSVNNGLNLISFRAEGNGMRGAYEIEIEGGIGYTIENPNFFPTKGAHCLGVGLRGAGSDSYVHGLVVTGGYWGTSTNTNPDQKAIVVGSDSRDLMVKGGRFNYQGSNITPDSLITDNGFRSSFEFNSNARFMASGPIALMRAVTAVPRVGEVQIFWRTNSTTSKQELCAQFGSGTAVVLATQP
jgi:hypothetical protein